MRNVSHVVHIRFVRLFTLLFEAEDLSSGAPLIVSPLQASEESSLPPASDETSAKEICHTETSVVGMFSFVRCI